MSYDYTFKIMMLGDATVGKTSLTLRYISGYYSEDLKLTLGTDFYSKTTSFNGKKVKLQIWDFGGEERFRFLLSQYCKGANAALFLYDITNQNTLTRLSDWTQIMREHAGNIPIMLVGTRAHLEDRRVVTREQGIQVAKNYKLSGFIEISSKTGQNVDKLFEVMIEILFGWNRPTKRCPEYKVNDYITLTLENDKTIIRIAGKFIHQCKDLLLDLPLDEMKDYDQKKSNDEFIKKIQVFWSRLKKERISPGIEFWGHCLNIQAWVKNNYDTRLLHRSLAFPLLRALYHAKDPKAIKVFKEEIAKRLERGFPSVVLYLIKQKYLDYLTPEELITIIENPKFQRNLPKWFMDTNFFPDWLTNIINYKIRKGILKNLTI